MDISNHPNTPPVDISISIRGSPSDDQREDILDTEGSPLHSPRDIPSTRVADGLLRAEGILIRRRRGDGSGLWIDPPPVPPPPPPVYSRIRAHARAHQTVHPVFSKKERATMAAEMKQSSESNR